MMKTHKLKILPHWLDAVLSGRKTFEYRKEDRGCEYSVGDVLHLREWFPDREEYGKREVHVLITYRLGTSQHGEHWAILAICIQSPIAEK